MWKIHQRSASWRICCTNGLLASQRRRCSVLSIKFALFIIAMYLLRPLTDPSWIQIDVEQRCSPKTNVVFLKVHKCASSAIQNIFMRYGEAHGLTFVLPPIRNYLGSPSKFRKEFALPLPSTRSEFNMFTHHARYSNKIPELMPRNTKFVAIVREPTKQFESLYSYYNLEEKFGNITLDEYVENPHVHFQNSTVPLAWNPMMFDFGADMDDFDDPQKIDRKILEIDKHFSLIMVADYMYESLVLLRDLLCWNWNDVITFRINWRPKNQRKSHKFNTKTESLIRKWNSGDVKLYSFFLAKFLQRWEKYGRTRMSEDVQLLKMLTVKKFKICKIWNLDNNLKYIQPSGDEIAMPRQLVGSNNRMFYLHNITCEKTKGCLKFLSTEIDFTDYLRERQSNFSFEYHQTQE